MTRNLSLVLLALTGTALAQGPLTPPPGADPSIGPINALTPGGLPQATMKTLHQVEPRTPLAAGSPGVTQNGNGGYTITAAGSYYLIANLDVATANGVTISASHVTLDLNGFTISSSVTPANGIGISAGIAFSNITIRNGKVAGASTRTGSAHPYTFTGAGFLNGVSVGSEHTLVSDLTVYGCGFTGIHSADGTVERCESYRNLGIGIYATTVRNCVAKENKLTGIQVAGGPVTQCHAENNGEKGILAPGPVSHCTAADNGTDGIHAESVAHSSVSRNKGHGIITANAQHSHAQDNDGHGFQFYSTFNTAFPENAIASSATSCTAWSNKLTGFWALGATLTSCSASKNGANSTPANLDGCGIRADGGVVSQCQAFGNLHHGIRADNASVTGCSARLNGMAGIWCDGGLVSQCSARQNTHQGINAFESSITNCAASGNGTVDISPGTLNATRTGNYPAP
jgi:hypothetical protein